MPAAVTSALYVAVLAQWRSASVAQHPGVSPWACFALGAHVVQVYSYYEAEMQPQLRTTLQDLQQLLTTTAVQQQQQESQQVLLLDTRSAAQYTAEVSVSLSQRHTLAVRHAALVHTCYKNNPVPGVTSQLDA